MCCPRTDEAASRGCRSIITFSLLRLAAGRGREVPVAMYVVSAVFAFYYLMPALGLT
ncbi:hypothetical protein SFUMM280S_06977 [Streptomyces fumanus]